jgi:hypothetical protein
LEISKGSNNLFLYFDLNKNGTYYFKRKPQKFIKTNKQITKTKFMKVKEGLLEMRNGKRKGGRKEDKKG